MASSVASQFDTFPVDYPQPGFLCPACSGGQFCSCGPDELSHAGNQRPHGDQKSSYRCHQQKRTNVRNGVEFVRQDGRTHGVDMRLNAPLPDFDTESSYEPRNLQSEVEREMQDRQTTDYVVERSWREIRKDLEQQTQNYVNYN
jgi:hypothetical protein